MTATKTQTPLAAKTTKATVPSSPWRRIFEDVRREIGNQRDENGVLGSINWLRKQMERRGANPNVVRNIIYRDKGKLADKRVLFEILGQLWEGAGQPPLQVPELEVLLSASGSAEQEALQLLGREKRRAYRSFVSGVRGGEQPKLLVTGRPGSGKTLLSDYIQQALELSPKAVDTLIRLEFSGHDLATSLNRLADKLELPADFFESRLVKIGVSSAYAVQADAQAEVAKIILDALRSREEPLVLLLHISGALSYQDSLGTAALRLNTPDVPRVNAAEWLWVSLLEPMSRIPGLSLLVTMADVPARALGGSGGFVGPIKLSPPTVSEARRFVKARLPHLATAQQEALTQRAGRSFEELRTLTLLAEIREPLPVVNGSNEDADNEELGKHLAQLSQLVEGAGDPRLRNFLAALAVLSLPDFPTFPEQFLARLRPKKEESLSNLERAFLDATPGPGRQGEWRCFSRQLARSLRERLGSNDPSRYGQLNRDASAFYVGAAQQNPKSEEATRYLHHLFEGRDWQALLQWFRLHSIQQSLLRRIWAAADQELPHDATFEAMAEQVAGHYVKLGSFEHPDAQAALAVLARSEQPERRAWTTLKRAEGAVQKGRFDAAEALLEQWPKVSDPLLNTEVALVRASIARWRSQLGEAAALVAGEARQGLPLIAAENAAGKLVHAKVAVWAGLIAKDRGDLVGALAEFESALASDDLIRARVAFQKGDVKLKLGRFDAALTELDDAVMLSYRSEAPLHEQARYLARRGTLHRERLELGSAEQDFEAALALLSEESETSKLERAFERAKVEDERALLLLAQGQLEAATFVLQHNFEVFKHYEAERQVDAGFRVARSTLRLSLAYACRGLGQVYRKPFLQASKPLSAHPDLTHARTLLAAVNHSLGQASGRERYLAIDRQTALLASLIVDDPQGAAAQAEGTLTSPFPYLEAESRAYLAAALLRGARLAEAQSQLEQAQTAWHAAFALPRNTNSERGDRGLLAWLSALELETRVQQGDIKGAGDTLLAVLDNLHLAPYHETLLRAFGEAIEGSTDVGWLDYPPLSQRLELNALETSGRVRLPDALITRWQQLGAKPSDPPLSTTS